MSRDFVQIASEVVQGVGSLREAAPEAMKAFGGLASAATATQALDTKTKELMALVIGIVVHCDGCVAFHTKMAHHMARPAKRWPSRCARRLHGRRAGGGLRRRCAPGLRPVRGGPQRGVRSYGFRRGETADFA
jgi:AhpD family alkylhydroperoxidase